MTLEVTPCNVGQKIRDRRIARGLTRADLAEHAGVSESYLGALEAGRNTNPTITILQILGTELKCDFLIPAGPYSAKE